MLFSIFQKGAYAEKSIRPGLLRVGALSGIFIYGVFGLLDIYMMPTNYIHAWIVRFGIVTPVLIFVFFLTYNKNL